MAKRRRGRPPKSTSEVADLFPSDQNKPTPPSVADDEVDDDEAALDWCRAVLWATRHMSDKRMTLRKAGSKLRYSMWQAAQKYPKDLLINLAPKAMNIIDRNKDSGEDLEGMKEAEGKSIKELEELLVDAVAESQAVA